MSIIPSNRAVYRQSVIATGAMNQALVVSAFYWLGVRTASQ
jgi:hypothetical protein